MGTFNIRAWNQWEIPGSRKTHSWACGWVERIPSWVQRAAARPL